MNDSKLTRREFLTSAAVAAGSALLSGPSLLAATPATSVSRRKRYALVGTGSRARMFSEAILKTYAEDCQLVGYCDLNAGRLRLAQQQARATAGVEAPGFEAKEFDRMIRETKPDVVVVTTKDSAHDSYIIRALQLGCDVITEKPMTTDEKKCRAILEAQRKTGRTCTVTFNYRYSPHRTQVKDLLMSGVIGDVLSVDFHWLLDTEHGADYFRRWHGHKAESGGLMVHKATHHFDLVNWWLSAVPVSVTATGKREFYTPKMAKRLGLESHHERCRTCPEKDKCTFYLDLAANRRFQELYLDNEQYDGYFRDRCVWRPDIDIEDTMNVAVRYNTGATLCYSLNAFNAWEGYTVAFNGTQGRLEHGMVERIKVAADASAPDAERETSFIRIIPLRSPAQDVPLWPRGEGGHAGGDRPMLDDLFLSQKRADKYLRASDQRAGAYSILTGIAANHSFVTGCAVKIADLVPNLALPDYPPMPTRAQPVPMPPRT